MIKERERVVIITRRGNENKLIDEMKETPRPFVWEILEQTWNLI